VFLEELDLSCMSAGWGLPQARRTVLLRPLTLRGRAFEHGVGTHAYSEIRIDLRGAAERFEAFVGVDDEAAGRVRSVVGAAVFEVWIDGRRVAETGVLTPQDTGVRLSVDLSGVERLKLVVRDPVNENDESHADWADAVIVLKPGATERPQAVPLPQVRPPLIVGCDRNRTAFHHPRVVGATQGRPFVFRLPVTGARPMRFEATGLPRGLALDTATGVISGALAAGGTTEVTVRAAGPGGEASSTVTIVAGPNCLARTPPMGWNSWNAWAMTVDDAKVRRAASRLVELGLADLGYQYVCIDDGWEGTRDPDGAIRPDRKFPDMRALGDYLHGLGLKFGIYSSPGPRTCGGCEGSYGHEQQDAATYAAWGVDLLKYDWCSYGKVMGGRSLEALQEPYRRMARLLAEGPRDIVFSICQYGMGRVWEWGREVGGHLWRTTGDIVPMWWSVRKNGFGQHSIAHHGGPGGWNDPDMLEVGWVGGWGPPPYPTPLTSHEQMTHLSLWALVAAPLLLGCDLEKMDEFTLALVGNPEVVAVDQDPLGRPGRRLRADESSQVWVRGLADGTLTVGLFNLTDERRDVVVSWQELGLAGFQPVRNLWTRTDTAGADGAYQAQVPPHGVVLVKIGMPARGDGRQG